MNQIFYFIFSYLIVFFGTIIFVNWWTNGFLMAFVKTKSKRGKTVLAVVKGKLDSYPSKKAWLEGKRFYYFDRETKKDNKNKVPKIIDLLDSKNPFTKLFNVPIVFIDEVNNRFIFGDDSGQLLGGLDTIAHENFIIRALQKPSEVNNLLLILVVIACVLSVVSIIIGIVVFQKVNAIPPLIDSLRAVSSIAGVNV